MSEQIITAIRDNGHDEYADPEDFLEAVATKDLDLPEDLRHYFPDEYVELVLGPRGSGKSIRVARKLLLALREGDNVFTNYELFPEKLGIDNRPKPLDLQFLLSFDTSLNKSVIGIGEVDTWIERKRAMSTSSILVEKFLNQLRKRGLRVLLDTQSATLPSIIMSKVDMISEGTDSYWGDWGRDHQVYKGTNFFYDVTDNSGIFTGHPGRMWREAIGNAQEIWPLYNTYQIFDPWQWSRKVEMVGGKMVFDMDEGKMYTGGEHNLEIEQREIKQFNTLLTAEYRAWGNAFIELAKSNNAVLEEQPNRWRLSIDGIQKAMAKLKGKKRKAFEHAVASLQKLANDSNGYLARLNRGENVIELARPIPEAIHER